LRYLVEVLSENLGVRPPLLKAGHFADSVIAWKEENCTAGFWLARKHGMSVRLED